MHVVWFFIQVIVILVVAQYVLTPFVLYFVTRQAAQPQFRSFDLLNPPLLLPPSYTRNIALLAELGFHDVAHVVATGQATSVTAVLTLFVNEFEKDVAVVAHMLGEIAPISRTTLNYVEFATHFEDGSEVCSNNADQQSSFAEVPEKKIFRLPHLTEPKQLYAVHRALLAQRPAINKWLPPAGEEVSHMVAIMEADLAREAGFGRLRLDDSGLWYRLTIKGAILNSLKFNWPMGSLGRHLQRWRGKRLADALLKDQY